MTTRICAGVEYDGSVFHGWQRQSHGSTVQHAIEVAFSSVADEAITVHCAGRTDTGVHATGQVIHFDTHADRSLRSWRLGVNSNLPAQVAVPWVISVSNDFDARHSAVARRYCYRICNRSVRPAIGHQLFTWIRAPLDVGKMHEAAQSLLGENDFEAFRAKSCQALHARRTIHELAVRRQDEIVSFTLTANGFLHHMVRNIVGSLLLIGQSEKPVSWMAELLRGRNRAVAGATAPSAGLTLEHVRYPRKFAIPNGR